MTLTEVMKSLEAMGSEQTRRIYINHGAVDPLFGVKVGDLKKLIPKLKGDQDLALALWKTGNSDARYLAGLLVDPERMTQGLFKSWMKEANWYFLSDYAVAGPAAESPWGWELAEKWVESKQPLVASGGWATYGGIVSIRPDDDLDLAAIENQLQHIETVIEGERNRVRYSMNGYVLAVGSYVKPLYAQALATAKRIGKVSVHMGNTECKVPFAPEYLAKVKSMNRVGKKRKAVRC
jgi:3-methyladenine DNA glycosylase AlkD